MRKLFFALLAALLPFCAAAQISASGTSTDDNQKPSRYDIFAGVGVTSQNQIVHSHGFLLGYEVGVTRNWGKYFGINVQGASMPKSTSSANQSQAGISPNYSQFLIGPELHSNVYEKVSGNVHLLMGGSHTGGSGVTGTPSVAFSYAFGAALDYRLTGRFSLRLTGDRVHTSFAEGAASTGNSPNPYSNVQSSFGVVYHWR